MNRKRKYSCTIFSPIAIKLLSKKDDGDDADADDDDDDCNCTLVSDDDKAESLNSDGQQSIEISDSDSEYEFHFDLYSESYRYKKCESRISNTNPNFVKRREQLYLHHDLNPHATAHSILNSLFGRSFSIKPFRYRREISAFNMFMDPKFLKLLAMRTNIYGSHHRETWVHINSSKCVHFIVTIIFHRLKMEMDPTYTWNYKGDPIECFLEAMSENTSMLKYKNFPTLQQVANAVNKTLNDSSKYYKSSSFLFLNKVPLEANIEDSGSGNYIADNASGFISQIHIPNQKHEKVCKCHVHKFTSVRLLTKTLNSYSILLFDHKFTSKGSMQWLYKKKIFSCGQIASDAETNTGPAENIMTNSRVKPTWQYEKFDSDVAKISSNCGPSYYSTLMDETHIGKTMMKVGQKREYFYCPVAVSIYETSTVSMPMFNLFRTTCVQQRMPSKMIFLMDILLNNSYIIWCKLHGCTLMNKSSYQHFLESVCKVYGLH